MSQALSNAYNQHIFKQPKLRRMMKLATVYSYNEAILYFTVYSKNYVGHTVVF